MSSILKPMFAYQGGKTKLASKIYNEITSRVGKDITYAEYVDFSKIKTDKDLCLLINKAECVGAKVFVSEYYNLSDDFTILSDTTKGGISGDRKGSMVEYLSVL